MFRSFSRLALFAVSVAAFSGPAMLVHAEDMRDVELHVAYDKVDFNNPAAVKKLYTRLKDAAYYVCEDQAQNDQVQTCVAQTLTLAVVQINHQQLSQIQEPKTLHPVELTMNNAQH